MGIDACDYDLALTLHVAPKRVDLALSFSVDLFDRGTAARLLGCIARLLEDGVDSPDSSLSDLAMIDERELDRMLVQWNRTERAFPDDACLHELCERQADARPTAIAVRYRGRDFTYADLDRRAERLAHRLVSEGVRPDDRIVILADRSIESLTAILGVLKAGAAYVPVDPDYPQARIDFIIEDTQCPIVLGRQELLGRICSSTPVQIALDGDVDDGTVGSRSRRAAPTDLAYVIYTSGSTGAPKGVMVEHRSAVNFAVDSARHHRTTDRMQQFASLAFDMAVGELFVAWTAGATLVFPDRPLLSVADVLVMARQEGSTYLAVPTAFLRSWAANPPAERPDSVRLIGVGGEKVERHDIDRWDAGVGIEWVNHYGPTEATVVSTSYPRPPDGLSVPAVPIGKPISNAKVYILDPQRKPTPIGVWGEIHISGVGVARGYLNRPELTADRFVPSCVPLPPPYDRMYRTGDLGRYLEDGNIEYGGRTDDQLKIRGFRIEPGEIEARLSEHDDVREAIVVPRQWGGAERRLAAYVVVHDNRVVDDRTFRDWVAATLPPYMVPAIVIVLDRFPLTQNGKVDRHALPSPSHTPRAGDVLHPSSPAEAKLVAIWGEVLGLNQPSADDDFLDRGGDSLLALELIARVEEQFDVEVPIRLLFEATTPSAFAVALETPPTSGPSHSPTA